eukprot:4393686-Pleurochrysis_carterae.AAC.1
MIATARAIACIRGSATTRSASGIDTLTPVTPSSLNPRRRANRRCARATAASPASPHPAAAGGTVQSAGGGATGAPPSSLPCCLPPQRRPPPQPAPAAAPDGGGRRALSSDCTRPSPSAPPFERQCRRHASEALAPQRRSVYIWRRLAGT